MSTKRKKVENRLADLRKERKLTQTEVGILIGSHHSTVSKHESGFPIPSELIPKYAKVFKCQTWELFVHPSYILPEGDEGIELT